MFWQKKKASSMFKRFAIAVPLLVMLLVTAIVPAQPASAATCTSRPRFTTWYNNKPTLYIWGVPGNGNDSTGIGIYYLDELGGWSQVSVSSAWGIQMVPQDRKDQWTGYYIASRWYLVHPSWDDDSRWYVQICR